MDLSLILGAALILGLALALVLYRRRGIPRPTAEEAVLPAGLALEADEVLTEAEASLYNVLRLAVQDQYLVFPKVPVWTLVKTQALDKETRTTFLRKVAFKRVDFALVHPGERTVVKVVERETDDEPTPQRLARNRQVDAICQAAGIEVVRLKAQPSCSVPELAIRLGAGPPD